MSCFCGQTHTSLATALACANRLGASQSASVGNPMRTLGGRSVSPHQHSMSEDELCGTSRLMGRRLAPVGELARALARARGEGLLLTSPRGGRPRLAPEERRPEHASASGASAPPRRPLAPKTLPRRSRSSALAPARAIQSGTDSDAGGRPGRFRHMPGKAPVMHRGARVRIDGASRANDPPGRHPRPSRRRISG